MYHVFKEEKQSEIGMTPYKLFCRKFYYNEITFPKVIEVKDCEDSYTWLFKNLTKNAKYAVLWEVYRMYENGRNFYGWLTLDVNEYNPINSLIIGIHIDRELRREKISRRLRTRLDEGMVDEVRTILATGVKPEDLIYYGLEYKFLTLYIIGELSFEEMVSQLEIAIHQFAKRQMTWFRGMERRGCEIHWIDATLPTEEKIATTMRILNNQL